jgi:hypothetical protein
MGAGGDIGRVAADGQSAPNPAAAGACSADREAGGQTRAITSPARRAKRRGPWGGASRCICAAHRHKMRPQNRESRGRWERWGEWLQGWRVGGAAVGPAYTLAGRWLHAAWIPPASTRGSHPVTACQHPWEPPGHRLPGPVGATRSPPAGTRGITLSELLLRPCQAPAKRACP